MKSLIPSVNNRELATLVGGGGECDARNGIEGGRGVIVPPVSHVWQCCCFRIDRDCAVYFIQTIVATSLIAFSCIRLAIEENADKSAPFWGLIGTMCGFIFVKAVKTVKTVKEKAGGGCGVKQGDEIFLSKRTSTVLDSVSIPVDFQTIP